MNLALLINRIAAWLGTRLQNNFYLYLGALFSFFILIDASVFHVGENMRQKAFDLVVKQRIIVPKPDSDIIIVDIDEKSIAALAQEYGRWPWPRQVFAEFIEKVNQQNPKAIVFDVLFSDPDIQNPDSDAYFDRIIAASNNTYFSFLRLSASDDKLSQIKPSMIASIRELSSKSGNPDATLALVLPNFVSALQSNRMGTINISPDKDGVVREYPLWGGEYGWRLPSLPLSVGENLMRGDKPLTQNQTEIPQKILLNWRGKPYTYRYVSFSDVFKDLSLEHPTRPANEFANKILLIGSTAASLSDIKATSMSPVFPGVEILATAIDNFKNQDYLSTWQGLLPYVLFSFILLWLTAISFFKNFNRDKVNRTFSLGQLSLLISSYITINLIGWYLDVTGPITWAVLYFSVAKIYALVTERALQRDWLNAISAPQEHIHILALLPFSDDTLVRAADLQKVKKNLERTWRRQHGKKLLMVSILNGQQQNLWSLYTYVILVSWTYTDVSTLAADQLALIKGLRAQSSLKISDSLRQGSHDLTINPHDTPLNQWRHASTQALLNLQ